MSSPENPIPNAEDDAEIAVDGSVVRMDVMPDMQFRTVDDVLERADGNLQVGMSEMTHEGSENRVPKQGIWTETEKQCRNIQKHVVEHGLEPVEPPVADPIELLNAVMDLVKLPQPRHAVKAVVDEVLEKVDDDEAYRKLNRDRPIGNDSAVDVPMKTVPKKQGVKPLGEADG